MKQIKLFSVVLLLATMFIGFNACSSDDDGGYEFIPDSGNKRITKIIQKNEYDDYSHSQMFSYSNGKMSKYIAQYKEYESDQTITYSNNTIALTGLLDGSEATQIYTLNNNGLAISCKTIYKDEGDTEEFNDTFQYSDGYLISISKSDYESTETFTLTYSNGNITKVIESGNDEFNSCTFDYSNNENKGIISPLLEKTGIFKSHKPAYYMGILGKPTKNLVISSTETDKFSSNNFTCVYALDNNNYVKTATDSDRDKFTYTFE